MNISNAKDISSREIDEKPDLGLKFPYIGEISNKKFLGIKSEELPQLVHNTKNKLIRTFKYPNTAGDDVLSFPQLETSDQKIKSSIASTKNKVRQTIAAHFQKKKRDSKGVEAIPKKKFSPADVLLNLMKKMKDDGDHLMEKSCKELTLIGDNGASDQNQKYLNNSNRTIEEYNKSSKTIVRKLLRKTRHLITFFISNLLAFLPLTSPSSIRLMIWRIIISLLITLNFFLLSINFFFLKNDENVGYQEIISFISIICFLADMMLKCSTGFYENGIIIQERKLIIDRYLTTSLIPDVFSLITLLIELANPESDTNKVIQSVFEILFFLKLWDIKIIFDQYQQMFSLNETFQALYSFFMLASGLLLVAHVFACFWFLVGSYSQNQYSDTWIKNKSLFLHGWGSKYITSLYWSLTTVLTVGYGDVTPQNPMEMLSCIIIMSFGCVVYGYLINQIGNILDKFHHSQKAVKRSVNLMDNYMKRKQVNFDLRFKIKNYLEYIFASESAEQKKNVDSLIDKLPESLKDEFLWQTDGKYVERIPFLFKNFSNNFTKKLITIMKQNYYSPGDKIHDQNEINCHLYIVGSGEVEISFGENTQPIKTLKEGDVFGIHQFVIQEPLDLNIRSKNYSSVYIMKRKDFLGILQTYPLDNEKFCYIKDKIFLYDSAEDLNEFCLICNKSHLTKNCDRCFFQRDHELVLKNYKIENFQISRSKFLAKRRRHKKSKSALKIHRHCNVMEKYPLALRKIAKEYVEFLDSLNPDASQEKELEILMEQKIEESEENSRQPENLSERLLINSKTEAAENNKQSKIHSQGNIFSRQKSELLNPECDAQTKEDFLKKKYSNSKTLKFQENEMERLFVSQGTQRAESSLKQSSSSHVSENHLDNRINTDSRTEKTLLREGTHTTRRSSTKFTDSNRLIPKAFEKGWNFEVYFPHNNLSIVLDSLKKKTNIQKQGGFKDSFKAKLKSKKMFSNFSPKFETDWVSPSENPKCESALDN